MVSSKQSFKCGGGAVPTSSAVNAIELPTFVYLYQPLSLYFKGAEGEEIYG